MPVPLYGFLQGDTMGPLTKERQSRPWDKSFRRRVAFESQAKTNRKWFTTTKQSIRRLPWRRQAFRRLIGSM